jgi:outer membrane murein-binding lipoprotein Lpp
MERMTGIPIFAVSLALGCLLLAGCAEGETVPPRRDPAAAVAEELAAAVDDGSNGALILFIARHPGEPLAAEARRRLAARPRPDPVPPGGSDGRIIAEFDAARLEGTEALRAFAAANPGHPLAAEAQALAAGR